MPESVRAFGEAVQLAYYKMRKDLITSHNQRIRKEVEEESELIRDLTRGSPAIECSDCGGDVARGNIRIHRRGGQGGCQNSRLNMS